MAQMPVGQQTQTMRHASRILAIMIGKAMLEAAKKERPINENRRRHQDAQKKLSPGAALS